MKVTSINQQVSQNTLSNRNNNKPQVGFSGSKSVYKNIWGQYTQCITENVPTGKDFDNHLLNAVLRRLKGQELITSKHGNKFIRLPHATDEPHKSCTLNFDVDNGSYSAVINGRSGNMTKRSYNQIIVRFDDDNADETVLNRLAEIFGNK